MKKILLIIPFLIGGINFAQAQQNNCAGPSPICKKGQPTCANMQAFPGGPISYGFLCFEDGDSLPSTIAGNGDKITLSKKETPADPCGGYIAPNPIKDGWAAYIAKYTKQPIEKRTPQKAYPLPAGPTTSGFIDPKASCAMGLVQPGPGAATQIPAADLATYNACIQQGRLIDCATTLYNALENNPAFTEILKKKCPALPPNTNASVFDAIWGFITHRKPY